jgi:transposase
MPGASVADVARRHGTTHWQVYDWRKKLLTGQLVVPESVAALPMFAELVIGAPRRRRRRRRRPRPGWRSSSAMS